MSKHHSSAPVLPSREQAAQLLVDVGRWAADRHWVPATSGNFSLRADGGVVAITRSGVDKGELTPEDILFVDPDGEAVAGTSAETPLHLAAYRVLPTVGAVLHTHSRAATVLSRRYAPHGELQVTGYELQKGISGVATHEGRLSLPIYQNSQDIEALADHIIGCGGYDAPAHGFLLAGHGLYTWAATARDARRHLVALEFLMDCILEEERQG